MVSVYRDRELLKPAITDSSEAGMELRLWAIRRAAGCWSPGPVGRVRSTAGAIWADIYWSARVPV